jgi:diaminopimelate decarboxylase
VPAEALLASLREVAARFGTPTYAYDCDRLRRRVEQLHEALPPEVDLLYSLKANAALGLCGLLARSGLGADVASEGELLTALAAGFSAERVQVGGPYLTSEVLARLEALPGALVSVDSAGQLRRLSRQRHPQPAILRLRPDFPSATAACPGETARFGLTFEDLTVCEPDLKGAGVTVVGFHVFSGSQVLDAEEVIRLLRGGLELCERAARRLGIEPRVLNLGGGFGVPYGRGDCELDLAMIGRELGTLVERARPAKIVLELGRYLVAQAGWYLVTVVGLQTVRGRPAVVVDGGVHQFSDLCGLGRRLRGMPPLVLGGMDRTTVVTDVLGSLCLPDDVLAESCPLPPLAPGDVLAFPNAGAYGFTAAPYRFLGHPACAEVGFTEGEVDLLRAREPVQALLAGQACPSLGDPGVAPPKAARALPLSVLDEEP